MSKEIELKYLVSKIPENFNEKIYIDQKYFNPKGKEEYLKSLFKDIDLNTINTFRLRTITKNNKPTYILTLKSKGINYSRDEYEIEIDEKTYNLLNKDIESEIIKNRYIKLINNYKFEFDEYLNLKIKLITLEVELKSEEKIEEDISKIETILNKLNISFENVTFDNRYKNSNLIKYFG